MFTDLSPAHIIILIVVALIVVGPQDLPRLLRKAGQFMGRMRGMANEFRASFDEMARQSELEDLRREVEAMRRASQEALPQTLGLNDAAKAASDAEAAYMANWEASHAPSAESFLGMPEPSILPPAAEAPASAPPPAATAPVAEPAPAPKTTAPASKTAKPRSAPRKSAKTDAAEPAPKTRVRKAKPGPDA